MASARISGLISMAQRRVLDPNGDRFTQAIGLELLNGNDNVPGLLNQLAMEHRCILDTRYAAKVENKWVYPMDDDFLEAHVVSWLISGKYTPLAHKSFRYVKQRRAVNTTNSYPTCWSIGPNQRIERVSGTCDAGGSGTSLVDASVNFSAGTTQCYAGDIAYNETDDSEATIDTPANGSTSTTALAGGADNTWSEDDTYVIVSPHAPLQSIAFDWAAAADDDTGDESIEVVYARKHRQITAAMIAASTDWLELPDELLRVVLFYLEAEGWRVLGDRPMALSAEAEAYNANIRARAAVRKRVAEFLSQWNDPHGMPEVDVTLEGTITLGPDYT